MRALSPVRPFFLLTARGRELAQHPPQRFGLAREVLGGLCELLLGRGTTQAMVFRAPVAQALLEQRLVGASPGASSGILQREELREASLVADGQRPELFHLAQERRRRVLERAQRPLDVVDLGPVRAGAAVERLLDGRATGTSRGEIADAPSLERPGWSLSVGGSRGVVSTFSRPLQALGATNGSFTNGRVQRLLRANLRLYERRGRDSNPR